MLFSKFICNNYMQHLQKINFPLVASIAGYHNYRSMNARSACKTSFLCEIAYCNLNHKVFQIILLFKLIICGSGRT